MSYFEQLLKALRDILKELKATRHAIQNQTKLLEEKKPLPFINIHDHPTEYPKEVVPALKAITWQEAVRTLRLICVAHTARDCHGCGCPMASFCEEFFQREAIPENWEVPADE